MFEERNKWARKDVDVHIVSRLPSKGHEKQTNNQKQEQNTYL